MSIHRSLTELPGDFGPCAITIGNFDGVHIGHQQILQRVIAVAREHGWKAAVLTFDPHPTHSTVEHSLQSVEKLAPRRAFFTHICHDLSHASTEESLPPHVRLAYDGLEILISEAA